MRPTLERERAAWAIDHLLIGGETQLPFQQRGYLCHARLAVTVPPDEGRGRIEAVGAVALQIVNEHLVVEVLDDEPLAACSGKR